MHNLPVGQSINTETKLRYLFDQVVWQNLGESLSLRLNFFEGNTQVPTIPCIKGFQSGTK
ncbi:hypothetical protein Q427_24780 [Halomonas sp. BC04]|nr:hypothetical protein Q427_24780 [Halomonas sp. BC04]